VSAARKHSLQFVITDSGHTTPSRTTAEDPDFRRSCRRQAPQTEFHSHFRRAGKQLDETEKAERIKLLLANTVI